MKKAVVLFSGGLDSSTCLAWAINEGYKCTAISFFYGQRHDRENKAARKIASILKVPLIELNLSFPWLKSSSLVDKDKKIPKGSIRKTDIPSTYVPGRNLVFASIGVSLADSIGAQAVVMGPNAIDYSGYPDCRPDFYKALNKAINLGTKNPILGKKIKIMTPIIHKSKAEIVRLAIRLKVPLKYTWSCYAGGRKPCGHCDSCKLRAKGFEEAGLKDPALEL